MIKYTVYFKNGTHSDFEIQNTGNAWKNEDAVSRLAEDATGNLVDFVQCSTRQSVRDDSLTPRIDAREYYDETPNWALW